MFGIVLNELGFLDEQVLPPTFANFMANGVCAKKPI
jgi:hypothetical protein